MKKEFSHNKNKSAGKPSGKEIDLRMKRTHTRNEKPTVDNSGVFAAVPEKFEGIFKVGKNGFGFVNHKESGFVTLVEPQDNNHSLNGDLVAVQIKERVSGTGIVTEIKKRAKQLYSGILTEKSSEYYLTPSDSREPEMRIAPLPTDIANTVGKKILVKLGTWIGDIPTASIAEVLGKPGDNDTEMNAIILEKGFETAFPEDVEAEANKLHGIGITDHQVKERRDMRSTTTFTIDPIDAKDFDDALSYVVLPDGNLEIGIHIADVSHYVRPGTLLDDEARNRTTSIYLVDRVVPMLPEVLSNELCSIRQDEDKLAFSTVFTINPQTGGVIDTWYGRTVIRSDKRFNYQEAQEIIDAGSGLYYSELSDLMRLSKIYTAERFEHGALSMDGDEVKFILDENGKPIRAMIKKRIDTMRMIEEWMLMANKYVAMKIGHPSAAGLAVYRIHDKPSEERTDELQNFLRTMGYQVSIKNGVIPPKELQKIINEAATDDARDTIQSSIVRSMAKAIYSTENIGHYGLAFEYYTHFTSPIRRYPDVMVHRLLQETLDGEKVTPEQTADIIMMCGYCSERERAAQIAERESIKYKQVEYMADRIGMNFDGIITGLGKFGAFVAEYESRSEGMIRLQDLGNDFFAYDEKNAVIKGQKSGQEFRIGQKIRIRVKEVRIDRQTIDYATVL
jgi:ribonuclease R